MACPSSVTLLPRHCLDRASRPVGMSAADTSKFLRLRLTSGGLKRPSSDVREFAKDRRRNQHRDGASVVRVGGSLPTCTQRTEKVRHVIDRTHRREFVPLKTPAEARPKGAHLDSGERTRQTRRRVAGADVRPVRLCDGARPKPAPQGARTAGHTDAGVRAGIDATATAHRDPGGPDPSRRVTPSWLDDRAWVVVDRNQSSRTRPSREGTPAFAQHRDKLSRGLTWAALDVAVGLGAGLEPVSRTRTRSGAI